MGESKQGERRGPTGEHFDIFFSAVARSSTLQRIWREAYGNDYPEEAAPASFVTRADLRRIAHLSLHYSANMLIFEKHRPAKGLLSSCPVVLRYDREKPIAEYQAEEKVLSR